jgi:hypothetical protein
MRRFWISSTGAALLTVGALWLALRTLLARLVGDSEGGYRAQGASDMSARPSDSTLRPCRPVSPRALRSFRARERYTAVVIIAPMAIPFAKATQAIVHGWATNHFTGVSSLIIMSPYRLCVSTMV